MKRILVVSFCTRRGNTTGLTGNMLSAFADTDRYKYEISLLDTNYFEDGHRAEDYPVDCYYSLPARPWDKLVKKIPGFRAKYAASLAVSTLKENLKSHKYDLIVIYQVASFADRYVKLCNEANVKVLMWPWGSDILCCAPTTRKRIQKAFDNVNFVGGAPKSNCILSAQNDYGVPVEKLRLAKNYLPGVLKIQQLVGKKNRKEIHDVLDIPFSDYNIVCCYNGYATHRHNIILDAIIANKDVLPKNYQMIFPMTYGAAPDYRNQIRQRCRDNQLNAVFFTSFLSNEQMAYLHLVTDLFINIQESDCGNAFMIEALFAKNKIVTGRWLHYEQFEQFGVPYYLIDTPQDLSAELHRIFTDPDYRVFVPEALVNMYRVPDDYRRDSYWTDLVDSL